jgi:hypothetical protein
MHVASARIRLATISRVCEHGCIRFRCDFPEAHTDVASAVGGECIDGVRIVRRIGLESKFEGVWSTKWCDASAPQRECGVFEIVLVRERERLCGTHSAATLGLSRIDEGDPASVIGAEEADTASLVLTSSRNGAKYLGTASMRRGQLHWRLHGMIAPGSDDEPTIVPYEKILRRDTTQQARDALRARNIDACRWPDDPARATTSP